MYGGLGWYDIRCWSGGFTGWCLDVLQWKALDDKIRVSMTLESPDRSHSFTTMSQDERSLIKPTTAGISRPRYRTDGGIGRDAIRSDDREGLSARKTPLSLVARKGIAGISRLDVDSGVVPEVCDISCLEDPGEEYHSGVGGECEIDDNDDDERRVVVGVEQLKHEVDLLLQRKSRLERDTSCLQEELDILVAQKGSTRLELSELTHDMVSVRQALASLQMDMKREQDAFMADHRKMLSHMDDDIEQKKSLAMKALACEKKEAEEKEHELDRMSLQIDARMAELKIKEEEIFQAREDLRMDTKRHSERCDAFQATMEARESAMLKREKECQEMWSKANSILIKEKEVLHKTQELIRDESSLQEMQTKLERMENKVLAEQRAIEKDRMDVVKERQDLEISKNVHMEHARREMSEIEKERADLDHRLKDCVVREQKLVDLKKTEEQAEEQCAYLAAQIEIHTKELEDTKGRLEQEKERLASVEKQKVSMVAEITHQIEGQEKKEVELNELAAKLTEENTILEGAKNDIEEAFKGIQRLVSDVKAREDALHEAKSSLAPQLEDMLTKKAKIDADFDSLDSIMKEMEKEGLELEERLQNLQQKEDEFEDQKSCWEKECMIKESLLQDVKETLDQRERELEAKVEEFEERMRVREMRMQISEEELTKKIDEFEESRAAKEAQLAQDRKSYREECEHVAVQKEHIEKERNILAEKGIHLAKQEENFQSEKERIENLQRESVIAIKNAEQMKREAIMDQERIESREKRVLQIEKEAEALQSQASQRNLEVSAALEKASQRESAAALRHHEAVATMQQALQIKEDSERKISHWQKEVHESRERELKALKSIETLDQEKLILQKSMESLRDLEKHLQEREWKLHESWKSIKNEASRMASPILNEPGSALHSVLELDALKKDALLAEEGKENVSFLSNQEFNASNPNMFSKIYTSWTQAAKKETLLQRWTVSLILESNRQKAWEDRLAQDQRDFANQAVEAKENRSVAEQLMKEIEVKEMELDSNMRQFEISQKKLHAERSRLEHLSNELHKQQDELETARKELYCRDTSLKSLESSWKDRMSEVRDREKAVSDLQRRLAHQREALEDRESRLLEAEEQLRDDTMAISSRRSALNDLETRLANKESELKEREADADALLVASRKEMELASHISSKSQARLVEIEERALELEAVSEHIDEKMKALYQFEELARDVELREHALAVAEDTRHTHPPLRNDMVDLLSA